MKIAEPKWSPYSKDLDQEAFDNPKVGDFWFERVYCPYFLIVQADIPNDRFTVLSCMGGPDSFTRKDEPYAKKDNRDGTWSFDYSKHMIVNKAWIAKTVKYGTIDGFVANVSRNEKHMAIVKEWIAYHTDKLLKELKDLGPEATMHMYKTLGFQSE